MPIYEYNCTKCKNKFEMIRSLKNMEAEAACPVCGGKAQRILSTCTTFSRGGDGITKSIAGTGSSCSSCSGGSCSGCH